MSVTFPFKMRISLTFRFPIIVSVILAFIGISHPANSVVFADTPDNVVGAFQTALLNSMKNALALGPKGRFAALEPIMMQAFDMPHMTEMVTGTAWNRLSAAQQSRLVASFGRFEIAQFADFLDGYQGQAFQTTGTKPMENGDVVVSTTMNVSDPHQEIHLDYTTHRSADGWKIDDIRFDQWMSVMARRSDEFKDILRRRGLENLIARLDRHTKSVLDSPDIVGASHVLNLRPGLAQVPILPLPLP
jgi:phospholipid transport system substrate-binding protein